MRVFVEGMVGKGLVATGAAGFEEGAVHVVDALGSGALVEVVYVLRAEIEVFGICFRKKLFDLGESFVGGVWLDGECVATSLRVEVPDQGGVGFPGFGGGDLFYTIAVP